MIKLLFTYCCTIFLFSFCTQNNENLQLSNKEKLEIALYQSFHHFQSNTEIELLKKYKIKSASFIEERLKDNKIDSTTFLVFNSEGQILKRTTSECTTVGCLPYIIRHEFVYKNNHLIQMKDFSYKKKFKSILPYWTLSDTSKLSKFDWEDYTYQKNKVRIESGPFIWNYKKNSEGKIIAIFDTIKSNKQTSKSFLQYLDSSITLTIFNSIQDSALKTVYEIKDDKVILSTTLRNDIFLTEFIFNQKGLLVNKLNYKNKKLISKIKINYSYFSN